MKIEIYYHETGKTETLNINQSTEFLKRWGIQEWEIDGGEVEVLTAAGVLTVYAV